jgi:hypothetical protein
MSVLCAKELAEVELTSQRQSFQTPSPPSSRLTCKQGHQVKEEQRYIPLKACTRVGIFTSLQATHLLRRTGEEGFQSVSHSEHSQALTVQ